jgi:benzoylformate decarboxylase
MAKTYKGKQILLETLAAEGVEYIFGNPGTTESPLLDALLDYPRFQYIVSLQEAVAVSMADAYAQASGKVAFCNLHVAPGLGNGLGSLYNAWEGRSPLVVTAGQQDTRMRLRDPLLSHDLVAMAAPLTKWSVQAERADELPLLLNRAFKIARETPSGPVFVSLPIDVMEQETALPALAPARLYAHAPPDPAGVDEAAALLLSAQSPLIVCGDGVARAGAQAQLVALAELLGAPVMGEVLPSRMNFPTTHPHYRDRMGGSDAAMIRQSLGNVDTVLLVGGEFFEEVWFAPGSPFPDNAVLIQIEAAPRLMAHNYPVNVGLLADPKLALAALHAAISRKADDRFRARSEAGRKKQLELKTADVERQAARAKQGWEKLPMGTARLMLEIKAALPGDAIIVQESITATPDLTRTVFFSRPDDFFGPRGGGIGQGLPSAIGVKLAHPGRPVVCLSGDGSSLYTIQALWSAAHHKIPVVFIILHNRVYRILKLNMNRYRKDFGVGGERPHPHMDLTDPEMDFVAIAQGFGVQAQRIERPEQVGPALKAALASGKPVLLDVMVDGTV